VGNVVTLGPQLEHFQPPSFEKAMFRVTHSDAKYVTVQEDILSMNLGAVLQFLCGFGALK